MPALVGATISQRVQAIVDTASDGWSGLSTGAQGASAAGPSTSVGGIDKAKSDIYADEVAAAMGQADWRNVEAQLTAELAQTNVSPLKLHDIIINSPLLGARRLALGSKDSSLSIVVRRSAPLARALEELTDFRAIASLMLVCDLRTLSTSEPNLISFRLSEKTSQALLKAWSLRRD